MQSSTNKKLKLGKTGKLAFRLKQYERHERFQDQGGSKIIR